MAIDMEPLLVPDGPPPMASGVEMYMAECHNRTNGTHIGDDAKDLDWNAATVLVSFSVDPVDRAALRPLLHLLSFARCSTALFGGTDWPERLSERLKLADVEFVSAVVFAGSQTDVVAESVQAAINVLRQCFGQKLAVLVVVCATAEKLSTVSDVSGFVRGAHSTNGETARNMFLTLAMLAAPKTLVAIDAEDLLSAFGSAHVPSALAEAIWVRDSDGPPMFLSNADEQALRGAGHVVMTVLATGTRLTEVRHVCNAIREVAAPACSFVYFAPANAIQSGIQSERVGSLLILGKPAEIRLEPVSITGAIGDGT